MPNYGRIDTKQSVFALAARAGSVSSSVRDGAIWPGMLLQLRVTAASGTGGLRVRIDHTDGDGNFKAINEPPTEIKTTGLFLYHVYPGASGAGSTYEQVVGVRLPYKFRFRVEHLDGSSYTYELISFFLV